MAAVCRHLLWFTLIPLVSLGTGHCQGAPQRQGADDPSAETASVNPGFCVIRPEEPASAEIYADYNGRRFYFCCESCRQDFWSDPSRFEGALAESAGGELELENWNPGTDPYAHSFWGRVGRGILFVRSILSWLHDTLHLHNPISITLAAAAALWFLFLGYRWRPTQRGATRLRPSPLTAALVTMLLAPCFYADTLRLALEETKQAHAEIERRHATLQTEHDQLVARDLIHYATFFNYGNPPVPRPSKLPASLRKTYYRGNDERSEEMFNGGNYRTVTFELWIEDGEGEIVEAGSSVLDPDGKAKDLFFAVRFIRSSDTSSGYFTDEYMRRMYLTMQAGDFLGRDKPIADRVAWEMIEFEKVWVARFPLPAGVIVKERPDYDVGTRYVRTVDPLRPLDRSGIVYLCEDRFWRDEMIGGRFHYAVQYELKTEEGVLLPESDLWMQATYHGRNFADLQIEDDEWLSSEPIPEK